MSRFDGCGQVWHICSQAQGLPMGSSPEYIGEMTPSPALEGRR